MPELTLPQGTIHVRETGRPDGPPIVFVHGFLTNGTLWRKVVPRLEQDFRCIWPDWPLGSHPTPLAPRADRSPRGVAHLVADVIAAMHLEGVTLVGNDTGGAICQMVAAERPERIGRLVLTSCDAFDNFPPALFRPLLALARIPGGLTAAIQPLRVRRLRSLPFAYGLVAKRPIDPEVMDGWIQPFLEQRGIRRDTAALLRGVRRRDLLATAEALRRFDRPALLAWAREDRLFPLEHAHRLAAILPQGRVEEIEDCLTFISEDQPERLADAIVRFIREAPHAPAPTVAGAGAGQG
jgi:pimeloyl-ACP methyl ester carboxylesterase